MKAYSFKNQLQRLFIDIADWFPILFCVLLGSLYFQTKNREKRYHFMFKNTRFFIHFQTKIREKRDHFQTKAPGFSSISKPKFGKT